MSSPSQPVTRPRGRGRPPDKKESIDRDAQTRSVAVRGPPDAGACVDPISFRHLAGTTSHALVPRLFSPELGLSLLGVSFPISPTG
jgi:hypothetical protein